MNRLKRPMAWLLCALLLAGQTGAVARADDGTSPAENAGAIPSDGAPDGVDVPAQLTELEQEPEEESDGLAAGSEKAFEEPMEEEPEDHQAENTADQPGAGQSSATVSGATAQGDASGAGSDKTVKAEGEDLAPDGEQGDASAEFAPMGEAWALLKGGETIDDTLQQILRKLDQSEEEADVYLTQRKTYRVTGVSLELFERVAFYPDPDRIENAELYTAYVEMATEKETVVFDISLLTAEQIERRESGQTQGDSQDGSSDSSEDTQAPGSGGNDGQTNPDDSTNGGTDEIPENPDDSQGDGEGDEKPEPIALQVEASGIQPGRWQNVAPTFSFTGIPEENKDQYVYGVFICEDRLVLLKNGATQYVPNVEGNLSFRFAILDSMGDVVAISEQFDVMLDMTPPQILIEQDPEDETSAIVTVRDASSGVSGISFDGGKTWEAFADGDSLTLSAYESDGVIEAGAILVRDRVGNIALSERFEFDWDEDYDWGFDELVGGGSGGSFGGTGSASKTIVHVKETMDYSLVNYNALELVFPEEPAAELIAGGTVLPLRMAAEIDGEQTDGLFSAKLLTWRTDEDDARDTPNALVLTAANESETNTWSFSGEAYRLLYNSGVDYLVFVSGEYMTAVPTEGFTGGTAYAKLKAGGISTRKFLYTLAQDETLRETLLSVEVEGEMYLLGEEQDQPMYRYDVLIGTLDMMQEPFASFLPRNQASAGEEGGSSNEG